MKSTFFSRNWAIGIGILVLLAGALWSVGMLPKRAVASLPPTPWQLPYVTEFPITGLAWSDMPNSVDEVLYPNGLQVGRGAGWLGFADKVPYDAMGYLPRFDMFGFVRGYIWSPNIGWVRLDPDETTFPFSPGVNGGPAKINLWVDQYSATITGTGVWSGWARACLVYQTGCSGAVKPINGPELGGWDGWIALRGTVGGQSYGWQSDLANPNNVGLTTGYAWGSSIMGWVNAQMQLFQKDMCDNVPGFQIAVPIGYTPDKPFTNQCDPVDTDVDFCTDITGIQDAAWLQQNGIIPDPVTDPATGAGICKGEPLDFCPNLSGYQDYAWVQQWLQSDPNNFINSNGDCVTSVPPPDLCLNIAGVQDQAWMQSEGYEFDSNGDCIKSSGSLDVDLSASPGSINCSSASSTLTWTINSGTATSCTAFGGFGFSGSVSPSGDSETVSGMTNISNTFTISCTGPDGSDSDTAIVQCVQIPDPTEMCGNGVDDDGDNLVGTTPVFLPDGSGWYVDEGCPGSGPLNPDYQEI